MYCTQKIKCIKLRENKTNYRPLVLNNLILKFFSSGKLKGASDPPT